MKKYGVLLAASLRELFQRMAMLRDLQATLVAREW